MAKKRSFLNDFPDDWKNVKNSEISIPYEGICPPKLKNVKMAKNRQKQVLM